MRDESYHYLHLETVVELDRITEQHGVTSQSTEELFGELNKLLPVIGNSSTTWKTRVEGQYHVSENFFNNVLGIGKARFGESWNRSKVISEARLYPFSHYHYLTGSREPVVNVLTRDDYLNDVNAALAKLEADITSLSGLLKKVERRKIYREEDSLQLDAS